eukprot:gene13530-19400_t
MESNSPEVSFDDEWDYFVQDASSPEPEASNEDQLSFMRRQLASMSGLLIKSHKTHMYHGKENGDMIQQVLHLVQNKSVVDIDALGRTVKDVKEAAHWAQQVYQLNCEIKDVKEAAHWAQQVHELNREIKVQRYSWDQVHSKYMETESLLQDKEQELIDVRNELDYTRSQSSSKLNSMQSLLDQVQVQLVSAQAELSKKETELRTLKNKLKERLQAQRKTAATKPAEACQETEVKCVIDTHRGQSSRQSSEGGASHEEEHVDAGSVGSTADTLKHPPKQDFMQFKKKATMVLRQIKHKKDAEIRKLQHELAAARQAVHGHMDAPGAALPPRPPRHSDISDSACADEHSRSTSNDAHSSSPPDSVMKKLPTPLEIHPSKADDVDEEEHWLDVAMGNISCAASHAASHEHDSRSLTELESPMCGSIFHERELELLNTIHSLQLQLAELTSGAPDVGGFKSGGAASRPVQDEDILVQQSTFQSLQLQVAAELTSGSPGVGVSQSEGTASRPAQDDGALVQVNALEQLLALEKSAADVQVNALEQLLALEKSAADVQVNALEQLLALEKSAADVQVNALEQLLALEKSTADVQVNALEQLLALEKSSADAVRLDLETAHGVCEQLDNERLGALEQLQSLHAEMKRQAKKSTDATEEIYEAQARLSQLKDEAHKLHIVSPSVEAGDGTDSSLQATEVTYEKEAEAMLSSVCEEKKELVDQLKKANAMIDGLQQELSATCPAEEMKKLVDQLEKANAKIVELQEELSVTCPAEEMKELVDQLEKANAKIVELEEEFSAAFPEEEKKKVMKQLEEAEAKIGRLEKELSTSAIELEQANEAENACPDSDLADELVHTSANLEAAELRLKALVEDLAQSRAEVSELTDMLSSEARAQISGLTDKLSSYAQRESSESALDVLVIKQQLVSTEEELSQTKLEVEDLSQRMADIQAELSKALAREAEMDGEIRDLSTQLDTAQSRVVALKEDNALMHKPKASLLESVANEQVDGITNEQMYGIANEQVDGTLGTVEPKTAEVCSICRKQPQSPGRATGTAPVQRQDIDEQEPQSPGRATGNSSVRRQDLDHSYMALQSSLQESKAYSFSLEQELTAVQELMCAFLELAEGSCSLELQGSGLAAVGKGIEVDYVFIDYHSYHGREQGIYCGGFFYAAQHAAKAVCRGSYALAQLEHILTSVLDRAGTSETLPATPATSSAYMVGDYPSTTNLPRTPDTFNLFDGRDSPAPGSTAMTQDELDHEFDQNGAFDRSAMHMQGAQAMRAALPFSDPADDYSMHALHMGQAELDGLGPDDSNMHALHIGQAEVDGLGQDDGRYTSSPEGWAGVKSSVELDLTLPSGAEPRSQKSLWDEGDSQDSLAETRTPRALVGGLEDGGLVPPFPTPPPHFTKTPVSAIHHIRGVFTQAVATNGRSYTRGSIGSPQILSQLQSARALVCRLQRKGSEALAGSVGSHSKDLQTGVKRLADELQGSSPARGLLFSRNHDSLSFTPRVANGFGSIIAPTPASPMSHETELMPPPGHGALQAKPSLPDTPRKQQQYQMLVKERELSDAAADELQTQLNNMAILQARVTALEAEKRSWMREVELQKGQMIGWEEELSEAQDVRDQLQDELADLRRAVADSRGASQLHAANAAARSTSSAGGASQMDVDAQSTPGAGPVMQRISLDEASPGRPGTAGQGVGTCSPEASPTPASSDLVATRAALVESESQRNALQQELLAVQNLLGAWLDLAGGCCDHALQDKASSTPLPSRACDSWPTASSNGSGGDKAIAGRTAPSGSPNSTTAGGVDGDKCCSGAEDGWRSDKAEMEQTLEGVQGKKTHSHRNSSFGVATPGASGNGNFISAVAKDEASFRMGGVSGVGDNPTPTPRYLGSLANGSEFRDPADSWLPATSFHGETPPAATCDKAQAVGAQYYGSQDEATPGVFKLGHNTDFFKPKDEQKPANYEVSPSQNPMHDLAGMWDLPTAEPPPSELAGLWELPVAEPPPCFD